MKRAGEVDVVVGRIQATSCEAIYVVVLRLDRAVTDTAWIGWLLRRTLKAGCDDIASTKVGTLPVTAAERRARAQPTPIQRARPKWSMHLCLARADYDKIAPSIPYDL